MTERCANAYRRVWHWRNVKQLWMLCECNISHCTVPYVSHILHVLLDVTPLHLWVISTHGITLNLNSLYINQYVYKHMQVFRRETLWQQVLHQIICLARYQHDLAANSLRGFATIVLFSSMRHRHSQTRLRRVVCYYLPARAQHSSYYLISRQVLAMHFCHIRLVPCLPAAHAKSKPKSHENRNRI